MFSSLDFLDVTANACAVSLVAAALLLLVRAIGVFVLELIPVGLGIALAFFGLRNGDSSSDVATLVLTSLGTTVVIAPLLLFYSAGRKAAGGESSLLVFSFAALNAVILLMTIITGGRSIPVDLVSATPGGFDRRALELSVFAFDAAILLVLTLCTRTSWAAAIQFAKDDDRLLSSFGLNAQWVRFAAVFVATLIMCLGIGSFIALQETFAVTLFEGILIPSLAIGLVLTNLSPVSIFAAAFLFIGGEQILTASTGELLRRSNQGMIFSLFAAASFGGQLRRPSIPGQQRTVTGSIGRASSK